MRRGVCLIDSSWINRLPHFDGEIAVDGKWLDIAELDFGKVRRHRPLAVLKPANSDDVVTAINFCRSEKFRWLRERTCAFCRRSDDGSRWISNRYEIHG